MWFVESVFGMVEEMRCAILREPNLEIRTMKNIEYNLATKLDVPAIRSLLASCSLMDQGIESCIDNCITAWSGSTLVGVVALELYDRVALLRSLAVGAEYRQHAIGRTLIDKLVNHACSLGVVHLYLLTTDAERYFSAHGFVRIQREQVPVAIQSTAQFSTLCPQSAVCMMRDIVK